MFISCDCFLMLQSKASCCLQRGCLFHRSAVGPNADVGVVNQIIILLQLCLIVLKPLRLSSVPSMYGKQSVINRIITWCKKSEICKTDFHFVSLTPPDSCWFLSGLWCIFWSCRERGHRELPEALAIHGTHRHVHWNLYMSSKWTKNKSRMDYYYLAFFHFCPLWWRFWSDDLNKIR